MVGFVQICFIKNIVFNFNIIIGDYIYYDDFEDLENFECNVLYYFFFVGDCLIIGKFCVLVWNVKFIMNGVNYVMEGFFIYFFVIFVNGW